MVGSMTDALEDEVFVLHADGKPEALSALCLIYGVRISARSSRGKRLTIKTPSSLKD